MSRVPPFNPPRGTQSLDEFRAYQAERRRHGLKPPPYKKPKKSGDEVGSPDDLESLFAELEAARRHG